MCFSSLIVISKLRHVLPKSTLKLLVQTLVFSHISYCLPAWAPTTDVQRRRIDKAINFGVRIVTGKRKRDRISESCRSLGWMTIKEMITFRDCTKISNIVHGTKGSATVGRLVTPRGEVSSRATWASSDRTTMQATNIRPVHLETVHKMFPHRALRAWNQLPALLRHTQTPTTFKNKLRQHILERTVE